MAPKEPTPELKLERAPIDEKEAEANILRIYERLLLRRECEDIKRNADKLHGNA